MTESETASKQEQADRFSAKLQTLYDGLPADEQAILEVLLQQTAGEDEVTGHIPTHPIRTAFHPGDPISPFIPREPHRLSLNGSAFKNTGGQFVLPVRTKFIR